VLQEVRCSVLQKVCCNVLQCVAMYVAVGRNVLSCASHCNELQNNAT